MSRLLSLTGALGALAFAFASLATQGSIASARAITAGAVYTITNDAANNQVLAFDRSDDGELTPAGAFDTGGVGNGGSLGSQGALGLSGDGRYIVAVNAGSNSVSLLEVGRNGLTLLDTEPAQGVTPISVSIERDLVYVVNDGSDSIAGFRVRRGELVPIAGSVEGLPAGSAPGQISLAEGGRVAVVTVKNLSQIVTFQLDHDGAAEPGVAVPSAAPTPFGFAIDRKGHAIVSEAPGSDVSSYDIDRDGTVALIDGPVPNGQGAACWVALSKDGKFAFSANAATANISTYAVAKDGSLTLVHAVAGNTIGGPQDLAVSNDGRFLYAVSRATHTITEFAIEADGSLTVIGSVSELAMNSSNGLVAK